MIHYKQNDFVTVLNCTLTSISKSVFSTSTAGWCHYYYYRSSS